jgi:hypothetical protein
VPYIKRGFVDDGSSGLVIAGNLVVGGAISSALSAGVMTTSASYATGQNLGAPTSWTRIGQWYTSSLSTPSVTTNLSTSFTINQAGFYFHSANMSYSGSAGIYTFALFQNDILDRDCIIQNTLAAGQPAPDNISLSDIDFYPSGTVLDIRTMCSNAGSNFQLNFGNFMVFRLFG